uniref:Tigger transposable element-derived protein 1-like n=1 Tax=Geotrypetes seraphini TaxID=260995 RepID=A0A6P8SE80_GEOSA|nr:tigger transposable element-derived protein 1-like [Geotrypetes seraphini]
MSQKRKSDASAGDASKKRRTITIEQKVEIIKRSERGETPSFIGKALGYSRSTIGTILKDKVRIMDYVKGYAPMKATVITKQRSGLIIKMEKLLIIWLEDQNQRNIPISLSLVQAKARSLFSDLKAHKENDECDEEFVASRGWFNRFKVRANLHNIKVQGEAASADVRDARVFPEQFKNIIEEGGYTPDQIFNVNETGLFWKKCLKKTYILKEEKSTPGHKALKEENGKLDTPEQKKFMTKELAEAFRLIEAGMAKLEEQDPNTERFTKVYRAVNEDLSCYKTIYNEKKNAPALLPIFKKSYPAKPVVNPHQQTANTGSSEVNPHSPASCPLSPTQDPSSIVANSPSSN